MVSPYDVLGIPEDASEEEIEEAYRERLKETHPDSGGSANQFNLVKSAYQEITADGSSKSPDDDVIRCSKCNSEIDDLSTAVTEKSTNQIFCSDCWIETNCRNCGKSLTLSIDQFSELDGNPICATCVESSEANQSVNASCFACGRSLKVSSARYKDQNGMVFCADCGIITDCARCDREIEVAKSAFEEAGGEVYCENCLVPFECNVCGEQKHTIPEKKSNNEPLVCSNCQGKVKGTNSEEKSVNGPAQCVVCGETRQNLVEFSTAPGEPVCQDCAPTARSFLNELNEDVVRLAIKGVKFLSGMAVYLFGAILVSIYLVGQYNLSWWMFFVFAGFLLLIGAQYSRIFEPREIVDLSFAAGAMSVAVLLWGGISDGRLLTLIGGAVISGVIIHELSHKALGLAFGKSAQFKAFYSLNLASIVLVYFTGLLLLLPGGVFFESFTDRATGIVAAAGPVSNILLAIAFLQISGIFPELALVGVLVNTGLAGFNMLPIPPLDGNSVLSWSIGVYVLIAGFIAAFGYQLFITIA